MIKQWLQKIISKAIQDEVDRIHKAKESTKAYLELLKLKDEFACNNYWLSSFVKRYHGDPETVIKQHRKYLNRKMRAA